MNRAATPAAELEARTQALGRQILEGAAQARARQGALRRQQETFLARLLGEEALRVRMLRFVDVLPALRRDMDLVDHLQAYLGDDLSRLPVPVLSRLGTPLDWGLRHAQRGIGAKVLAAATRAAVGQLARRFIAGHDVATAGANLHRLHRRSMGFTLDVLGEATVSEAEADALQAKYLHLLEALDPPVRRWRPATADRRLETLSGRPAPRLNLSVKVSSLYSQLDPIDPEGSAQAVKARLRPIMLAARRRGAFITLDMESYPTKTLTLRIFRELLAEPELADWPDAGIAVQAYLRDTGRDLDELIAFARGRPAPFMVRLVRGAYWDFETVLARQHGWPIPVWVHKADTDACYEHSLRRLLGAYPHIETAIATHNVRSMAYGMALAESLGLQPTQYELQMLYGMADEVKEVLVGMGQRLRVYVPFGELIPGMAYLVRRLLENSSSQSFVRLGMGEEADGRTALAPPQPVEFQAEPPAGAPARAEGQATAPQREAASAAGDDTHAPSSWTAHEMAHRDLFPRPYFPEPHRRFIDPAERQALAGAIEQVRTKLGQACPLVIDGQPVETAATFPSINPADPRQVVGVASSAGPAAVARAIEAAQARLPAWRATPAAERAAVLVRAAAILRRRRDELAAWEIFESAKPWREADADIAEAIDFCEYYAREMVRLDAGLAMDVPGEENRFRYEPRGVAAVIAPWNFPLAIAAGMVTAALVTGNVVLFKPAPQTPVIGALLAEVLHEAGLPPGVLAFLPGGDETGKALVADPRVHLIAFTGSEAAGKAIYAAAAEVPPGQHHLKRVIAEMGGKNAIVVDRDADLDDAVRGVVASAFSYAGQKCSACSRLIVVGELYEPLLARLVEAAGSVAVGPPEHPGTFVGPVIDEDAHQRLHAAIAAARSAGYRVFAVDAAAAGPGCYVGPAVVADVPPDSELAQNELFGPVLAVMRAGSFEEAIELANATRYALTGGVYSRHPGHLAYAREHFRVGNLYLNRRITGAVVGRQPFGGFQLSGVGSKAGGPDYLLQFLEPRTITENTLRQGFAPRVISQGGSH